MNPAYQDLAFAVFTMMVGMVPFDKALKIAEVQVMGKFSQEDVEEAKTVLESKIKDWEHVHAN
jgi:hypothetical protein